MNNPLRNIIYLQLFYFFIFNDFKQEMKILRNLIKFYEMKQIFKVLSSRNKFNQLNKLDTSWHISGVDTLVSEKGLMIF